jgi:hypothetical protein
VLVYNSGTLRFLGYDNAQAAHYADSTNANFGVWRTYSMLFDFSNLANMAMTVDGSTSGISYSGNSGTATLDLRETVLTLSDYFNGAVNGNAFVRNLLISPEE